MDELTKKILQLIRQDLDTTAELIEGESGVIGLEYDGETWFVSVSL